MNPKEKAKNLVDKFENIAYSTVLDATGSEVLDLAKQCALIAVEEILKEKAYHSNNSLNSLNYWNQVKTEIEKL